MLWPPAPGALRQAAGHLRLPVPADGSEKNQRRVGRFAWVMAWVGLVVGQVHALSRFATAAGKYDLELPLTAASAEPATDLLAPLLTWAGPDVVYVAYGKVWFPVFAAFTLCAYAVYRRRQPGGFEKEAGGSR